MEGCQPDTVWTWNAIGKQKGAWGLDENANESNDGFLMNHLISELLPAQGDAEDKVTNSDPITGQAAWYDLKVKIYPADESGTWPTFPVIKPLPNSKPSPQVLRYQTHKAVNLKRALGDILTRGSVHDES